MATDIELMIEAARLLAHETASPVDLVGHQLRGVAGWCIDCHPRPRAAMLPLLWGTVLARAEAERAFPMLMHLRRNEWVCTALNCFTDDPGTGFDNTATMRPRDWWLFHGEAT
jgi:hypothetical protein